MSIECFEVSFEKEVFLFIHELNQISRDVSLVCEPSYHDRITHEVLTF
jgi:hypothetical protein